MSETNKKNDRTFALSDDYRDDKTFTLLRNQNISDIYLLVWFAVWFLCNVQMFVNNCEPESVATAVDDLKWHQKYSPSVEITMFLYMMAYMTTSVIEQAFFVYRACRVNHGYSEEICSNIANYTDIKKEVQKTVSNFHQWDSVLGHIVPIILALFIGSWSDRRGRKLPLIMGLCGKLIYSVMIVVNTYQTTWPLEYVIWTATFPGALTGADVAIFASCFAYISDISTTKQRTIRVTILDACYLSTIPTGVALGSYLFNQVVNKSYSIMFIINSSLLATSILYSSLVLKWQTNPQQKPLTGLGIIGIVKDFFDKQHVIDSFRTFVRKRDELRRLYLWIFMFAMALYTFQRDEKPMMYMYMQLKFNWDESTFSNFRVFQSSAFVAVMLAGIPLMNKIFGFRDTTIVMIGAASHATARLFFGLGTTSVMIYIGGAVSSIGPIVAPVLRSMTSKVVPAKERGKVFAILSVFDNAVPIFSGVLYSQLYTATLETHPAGIFWLTLLTQVLVMLFALVVHITLGKKKLEVPEYDDKANGCLIQENEKQKLDEDIVQ